jgi:hypothetical protein
VRLFVFFAGLTGVARRIALNGASKERFLHVTYAIEKHPDTGGMRL